MACPLKYRRIGDFHSYYSGARKAPYLTIFVGGNHEASNHLWELFYGGWVAPNIYYMGAANVVRIGGVRILGMSGIWKGYNFRKPHYERLPYNQDDIRSIYHVREIDIRKLLQIRTKVDVGISHDWPKTIELYGNTNSLFKNKPDFKQESRLGTFGNEAARLVMDRLRPHYWFSAHMHCKYAATKLYDETGCKASKEVSSVYLLTSQIFKKSAVKNEDEIDLDLEQPKNELAFVDDPKTVDEIDLDQNQVENDSVRPVHTNCETMEIDPKGHYSQRNDSTKSTVDSNIRAQLPESFYRHQSNLLPPADITNKTVRFLSLDKCLPGRKFLQLLTIDSQATPISLQASKQQKPVFEYDPEWLAITRVFDSAMVFGDRNTQIPPDLGEAHYLPLIQRELEWVDEHVVKAGKLEIPENFQITATPYQIGAPEIVKEDPMEFNNPQTQQFCDLIGIKNKLFATDEERADRIRKGPASVEETKKWNHNHSYKSNRNNFRKNGKNFGGNCGRKN